MDQLEEIRSRINIEDLVAQYVQLKKAGKNYKGLCPFHNEKTPSFIVSPDKGLAYCFGCHQGGDIFKFMQLVENVEFGEAVKLLADKAGVKLKTVKTSTRKKDNKIQNINELACNFFIEQLEKNPEQLNYLKERGLNPASIKEFRIGFAPNSYEKTYQFLLKQDFSHKEIIDSGLAVAKNLTELKIYDRFRNRIMFPIGNVQGQIIAFGGRTINPKEQAKYLNSPESIYYKKSYTVYGLSQAKESIRKNDQVIIVEGYMDVISSHQAGIKNVVASSGTALTAPQIKLLKRYTKNFIFSFDTDLAGKQATRRAIELALPEDINIRIIQIPEGKDPDECIKNNPQVWEESIQKAAPVLDFYLEKLFQEFDASSIIGKKQISQDFLPLINLVQNQIEKNFYLQKLSQKLKIDLTALHAELKKISKKNLVSSQHVEKNIPGPQKYSLEEYLFGFLLNKNKFAALALENIFPELFTTEDSKKIYNLIKNIYNRSGTGASPTDIKDLSADEKEKYQLLSLLLEEKYADFSVENCEKEILKLAKSINKNNFSLMQKTLIEKLRNTDPHSEEARLLLNKMNEMLKIKIV